MPSNLVDYRWVAGAARHRETYSGQVSTTRHPHDVQSVTSAPEARTEDQARRLKRYLITMAIRTACFVLLVVVDAWYRWIFAAGAVFLPFIAVVAANAVMPRVTGRVRPVLPVVDETPQITRGPDEPHESDGSAADR
jgi:Protein of unknown function (DUF3099)